RDVSAEVLAALEALPETMTASGRRAGDLTRACEAAVRVRLFADRVGHEFRATVLQSEPGKERAEVLLADPPVEAVVRRAGLVEGDVITVVLDEVVAGTGQVLVSP